MSGPLRTISCRDRGGAFPMPQKNSPSPASRSRSFRVTMASRLCPASACIRVQQITCDSSASHRCLAPVSSFTDLALITSPPWGESYLNRACSNSRKRVVPTRLLQGSGSLRAVRLPAPPFGLLMMPSVRRCAVASRAGALGLRLRRPPRPFPDRCGARFRSR